MIDKSGVSNARTGERTYTITPNELIVLIP